MSPRSAGTFFARLIPSIIFDLRRIASRSRGETTVEDLQTEAWLVAEELSRDRDPPPDASDKGFQQQILGRLYNRFVKFADQHLRFAARIDEQREDDDGGVRENSIAAALAAPPEYDPSRAIENREDERKQERQILGYFAEAVAYLRIFAAMKNDRCAVADHLAIGAGTLRRRIEHAEWTVKIQPSLFDGITAIPDDFMPPRGNRLTLVTTRNESRLPRPLSQFRLFVRAYIPIRGI
ncbi:hypothetical protein K6V18_16320 [Ralstonia insidiosa]|uniref:hypothetical protein n=1 Tax=Ralstonia TaxID=48736 RepID=UPI00066DBDF0|nr:MULTISPECIES: hypothetical protein [Ralstonia]MBY4706590.1 hypothetical protein [Ralstonia insidiosa]GAQ27634.1 hypothetical protein SAMD00023378_1317 [Ralstonia sp. NT80]